MLSLVTGRHVTYIYKLCSGLYVLGIKSDFLDGHLAWSDSCHFLESSICFVLRNKRLHICDGTVCLQ